MAIIASKGGKSFELTPEGTYQGVVFAVYDMGDQSDKFNPGDIVHKIRLGIELNELYTSGQYAGSRITKYPEYTLSLNEKSKLFPVVESILGRALGEDELEAFDLETLIGYNCAVTIIHKVSQNGKDYVEVKIGSIMKGTPLIAPVLESSYVPDHIAKMIKKTHGDDLKKDKTKFEMFNEIQDMVKSKPELKAKWDKEFTSLGKSMSKISDEQMSDLYTSFVLWQ